MAHVYKLPTKPLDWKKAAMNNRTQYCSVVDDVKVHLNYQRCHHKTVKTSNQYDNREPAVEIFIDGAKSILYPILEYLLG